jgi:glycosyltransferase involved in cell wall biosynthesis
MAVKYSFCIITDNREPDKLNQTLASIHRLNIEDYEIHIAIDEKLTGRLGHLRNRACESSSGDVLIVADDDLVFHTDFYTGLLEYGDDWDVLSCRILNPDGSRFWDWKAHNGNDYLLDYDETSPHQSLTGGLTIMKRWVWDKVKWDDQIGFYQMEDVDYSCRLKEAGVRIAFNPHSTVTHDDPRYTQSGKFVLRREYG